MKERGVEPELFSPEIGLKRAGAPISCGKRLPCEVEFEGKAGADDPVEKTAGSVTSATPKSTPSAKRTTTRELVTSQLSLSLPSRSLPY